MEVIVVKKTWEQDLIRGLVFMYVCPLIGRGFWLGTRVSYRLIDHYYGNMIGIGVYEY